MSQNNARAARGIELRGVEKRYAGRHVLGPIDLAIERGGVTALIGANGAGKPTMLTIIGRLLEADSGRVEVGGLDVRVAKSKELANVVSILRQENHFMARLTVEPVSYTHLSCFFLPTASRSPGSERISRPASGCATRRSWSVAPRWSLSRRA